MPKAGCPVPGTTSLTCRTSTCRSPLPWPPSSSWPSCSWSCAIARGRAARHALPGTATSSTPRLRWCWQWSWPCWSRPPCAPTTRDGAGAGRASGSMRSPSSGAGSSATRRGRVSSIARPRAARRACTSRPGPPSQVDLRTRDVVHAFWIPDLRFKRDAWPRKTARFDLRFAAGTVAGVGHCAQFCGLKHSDMVFFVDAMDPARFAAWSRRAGGARERDGTPPFASVRGLVGLAVGHGPQGRRPAPRRRRLRLLPGRRGPRAAHARRARAAGDADHLARRLRPAVLDARLDDDLPLRHAGRARAGHLLRAAAGRRRRDRVAAAEPRSASGCSSSAA